MGKVLKGSNNEVILEFTPKGSSNDVKKYLDELPADLVPVKGSEAAKLRKQRLQKQMPAHDIDPTLCHALTDDETKQLEEYVAFIRKHSVGKLFKNICFKKQPQIVSKIFCLKNITSIFCLKNITSFFFRSREYYPFTLV